jgi:UDP-glucuronate decarboxylase
VDDLIEGMMCMMRSAPGFVGPVNLGNPVESTILELAEHVLRLTGSSSKVMFRQARSDDPAKRRPDISMAERHLEWRPKVTLEDGLRETIRYFRDVLASATNIKSVVA